MANQIKFQDVQALWMQAWGTHGWHPAPWLPQRTIHVPTAISPVFTGKKTLAST